MLRRYWLLVMLLLPFLALSGGGAGAGFASETQVSCRFSGVPCIAGQPFEERHAIVSDASESADEEGPPEESSRANPVVLWTREILAGSGYEIAPSYVAEAPIVHAGRPRAPPQSL